MECLLLSDATLSTLLTQPHTIISGLLLTFSVMRSVCQLSDRLFNEWVDGRTVGWEGGSRTEMPSDVVTPLFHMCALFLIGTISKDDYIKHNI